MGYFKIENQIARQVNYDDIATSQGWTGVKKILGANGYPALDPKGVPIVINQTSQEFICELINTYVETLIKKACKEQELLNGKLNYNAQHMIDLFKKTMSVSWIEE